MVTEGKSDSSAMSDPCTLSIRSPLDTASFIVIRHEKDDTNILDTYLPTYLSLVVADLVRELCSDRETHKGTVKVPL